MDRTEALVKHLEMIERVVTQFSNKSFLLKGWTITAVAALLALSGTTKTLVSLYVAFLPAVGLWVLDAYFLSKERCFRRLFFKVQSELETSTDMTKLAISSNALDPCMPFTMDTSEFEKYDTGWFKTVFNKTLVIFYGSIFTILIALTLVPLLIS